MNRRGFTLIEVLIATLLLSTVGLMLAAGGRWFLLAMTRTAHILLARDRGRRVIAFLEPRVLHAGLGLSSCRGAGSLLRNMNISGKVPLIANLMGSNRFIIVYTDTPTPMTPAVEKEGVISGVAFCAVYAMASGIFLGTRDGEASSLPPGDTVALNVISGDWLNSGFQTNKPSNLRSWCVLPLTGMPFLIKSGSNSSISLAISGGAASSAELSPVNEMLSLRCDRFRVQDGVFRYQGMEGNWTPSAFYPREDGVMSMWVEWRPRSRTFDIYVLASGGPAVFGPTARPPEWPDDAPWMEDFAGHELYVSRASWRLENI